MTQVIVLLKFELIWRFWFKAADCQSMVKVNITWENKDVALKYHKCTNSVKVVATANTLGNSFTQHWVKYQQSKLLGNI